MNILCPNCQRPLTVQEQYAGQMMKCPLCGGTFTVPALASTPATPPMTPPPSSPPTPSATPPFEETWPPPSPPEPSHAPVETYGLSSPPPSPERPSARERPSTPSPAPEPPQYEEPTWEMPAEEEPPPTPTTATPAPSPPPAGYTRTFSLSINPRILPWIAPGAVVAIFFLMFFPWVGMYPNGTTVARQRGWQTFYGGYYVDEVWQKKVAQIGPDESLSWSNPLMFFYVLVLLLAVAVTVGATLIHLQLVPIRLPVVVEQYWRWRPLIVGGVILFGFLILALQLLINFSLESRAYARAEERYADEKKQAKEKGTQQDRDEIELREDVLISSMGLRRTFWLRLVVLLHLIAIGGVGLEYWMERRGTRPPPRLDVMG